MSVSRWIIAIVFGLVASLGQAQEQANDPSDTAPEEQNPAQVLPIPLPVDIIDDEAATETRQRSEQEAREREIADLAAQQGMNAATQSIERATLDMRDYAFYSTVAVWIGTALLLYTLWLTRQANRAAQAAVNVTREIGEAQSRAYLSATHARAVFLPPDGGYGLELTIRNTGQSPARGVAIQAASTAMENGEVLYREKSEGMVDVGDVEAGYEAPIVPFGRRDPTIFRAVADEQKKPILHIAGAIKGHDVFGRPIDQPFFFSGMVIDEGSGPVSKLHKASRDYTQD
ncbi:hypothetical protein [Limimaricola cinnabarinus]|uniref:Uncharacterized protein n=1 Tax=Limimaricola cinnabarinus TaxID=1125964 RepID=A0A2G1MH15_9RHOB|nr:hypothetical protein [Limimaricola cinnabarinus]PHP28028.1 hypothetical protein CJ301_08570 [Limimaricola cinnabarinus]